MIEEKTTLQPGKVRTSKLGFETLTVRVSDRSILILTLDPESNRLRMALSSYEGDSLELLKYDGQTLEVKL